MLKNLPKIIDEKILKKVCLNILKKNSFNENLIKNVGIKRDKKTKISSGYGFIQMYNHESAKMLIENISGYNNIFKNFSESNRRICAEFAMESIKILKSRKEIRIKQKEKENINKENKSEIKKKSGRGAKQREKRRK